MKVSTHTAMTSGVLNESVMLERLCTELGLHKSVKEKAYSLWETVKANSEEEAPDWIPLVIYIAIIELRFGEVSEEPNNDTPEEPCCSLSAILQKANLNFIQFSEQMRAFRECVPVSEDVRNRLSSVEKRYCIISPLFHRFEKQWGTVFREDEVKNGSSTFLSDGTEHRKKKCWTLFLLAKEQVPCEELVQSYHLLLCCMEHIIRQTPAFQLNSPFDSLKLKSSGPVLESMNNTGILHKLAECFQTSAEELLAMQIKTDCFFTSLEEKEGEMDLERMKCRYYEKHTPCGLDELLFLQHDPHLMPPRNVVQCSVTSCGIDQPVTPIRAALNTIQQLKDIISVTHTDPLTLLTEHLNNCSTSPEASMRERVSVLGPRFIQEYVKTVGTAEDVVAQQRYSQATNLYYRVMKRLLDTEKERLSQTDFSSLLNNDVFHRSLLACSCEIVLMTYNVAWNPAQCSMASEESRFTFPWILGVFNLCAYDFQKVLECFVKAEPNLTREIIKHLTHIESKILDSIAWQSDSPLFEVISRCGNVESSYVAPGSDLTNGHFQASNPAELYLSPHRGPAARGTNPDHMRFASPRKGSNVTILYSRDSPETRLQGTSSKRSHSLTMFFNKVCRLGYHRLKTLTDLLQVSKDTEQKIWTCLEYCITSQPDMLKDRHLDQMMMCSVYGICKVSDCEIKFKDIVKAYSTMPHAQPPVYKEALIEPGTCDSIIMFYNRVYMHLMKNFILQFAKPVQPNLSPLPKPTASPAYSLPGRKNFYISPLKESPFKSPHSPGSMTPRSRQLYSFGEGLGSAEKLKSINESISAFKSHNNNLPYVTNARRAPTKRLSFENMDDSSNNQDECNTVVVKKKRITPPAVVSQPTRNSCSEQGDDEA